MKIWKPLKRTFMNLWELLNESGFPTMIVALIRSEVLCKNIRVKTRLVFPGNWLFTTQEDLEILGTALDFLPKKVDSFCLKLGKIKFQMHIRCIWNVKIENRKTDRNMGLFWVWLYIQLQPYVLQLGWSIFFFLCCVYCTLFTAIHLHWKKVYLLVWIGAVFHCAQKLPRPLRPGTYPQTWRWNSRYGYLWIHGLPLNNTCWKRNDKNNTKTVLRW